MFVIRQAAIPEVGESDIVIDHGHIVEVVEHYDGDYESEYNAKGLFAFPGGIDMHVHFRIPGNPEKENWVSGSRVALAAGYTTVCDMPNTTPATISVRAVEEKKALIQRDAKVRAELYIGATSDNLDEIIAAQDMVCGVKVYYGTSTGNLTMNDPEALRELFEARLRVPIVIHAEDDACIEKHAQELATYSGVDKHSKVRDKDAAITAVRDIIALIKETGATNVHITHVTTAEEIALIQQAQNEGVHITCDVAPHHLTFTIDDYERLHGQLQVNPPVRTHEDVEALWQGIRAGVVSCIASDHAPHTLKEKKSDHAPSGIPSLHVELLLLLEHASSDFSYADIMHLTSTFPAQLLGFTDRGAIEKGKRADITLIDPAIHTSITKENMHSACGWSPWKGKTFSHSIAATFVDGQLFYERGHFTYDI
ncbi:MAG: dihydroorotase [Candidatus Kerfeldbacteria bacterium]|nr:dihydroorotase [Candidatus Kerfeldbacteria bacterium]